MAMSALTAVRLGEALEDRLARTARRMNRPRSGLIREALERYLDDLEDYARAVEAWEVHVASGEETLSLEAVKASLGLEA